MDHIVQIGEFAWLANIDGRLCVTTSAAHARRYDVQVANALAQDFRVDPEPVLAGSSLTAAYRKLAPSLPVTVRPATELDFRLNAARSDRGEAKPAAPKPTAEGKPERAPGVTRQIYQWVLDHQQASKSDALAAFPSANPSTVGVQFGAARKAQRG